MHIKPCWWALVGVGLLGGCPDPTVVGGEGGVLVDGGATADGGTPADSGSVDDGGALDAGRLDGGRNSARSDAGADGGPRVVDDGGAPPLDGGQADGGPFPDGGAPHDGGESAPRPRCFDDALTPVAHLQSAAPVQALFIPNAVDDRVVIRVQGGAPVRWTDEHHTDDLIDETTTFPAWSSAAAYQLVVESDAGGPFAPVALLPNLGPTKVSAEGFVGQTLIGSEEAALNLGLGPIEVPPGTGALVWMNHAGVPFRAIAPVTTEAAGLTDHGIAARLLNLGDANPTLYPDGAPLSLEDSVDGGTGDGRVLLLADDTVMLGQVQSSPLATAYLDVAGTGDAVAWSSLVGASECPTSVAFLVEGFGNMTGQAFACADLYARPKLLPSETGFRVVHPPAPSDGGLVAQVEEFAPDLALLEDWDLALPTLLGAHDVVALYREAGRATAVVDGTTYSLLAHSRDSGEELLIQDICHDEDGGQPCTWSDVKTRFKALARIGDALYVTATADRSDDAPSCSLTGLAPFDPDRPFEAALYRLAP